MDRVWIASGALAGLGAVAMAALAAHGLDPAAAEVARAGVQMQGWHAIMLVVCGVWRGGGLARHVAAALFLAGMVVFCGAVYGLALAGLRPGPLAPAGGFALMAGWAVLFVAAWRG